MAMSLAWIDELFTRLSVRYGAAFLRQYADLDAEAVKADWSHVLDGVSGDGMKYGLKNLPSDYPPTALQFRVIVNGRPRADEVPAIGYTRGAAAPEVRERMRELLEKMQAGSHPHTWEYRLKAKRSAGERLSMAQTEALERFDRNTGSAATEDFDGAGFTPIPPEAWPWNTAA